MATGIDHVVIAVNDLDQAIADYTSAGFTVSPGGEHTNAVTKNALIAFAAGGYFELIAWNKPDDTVWSKRLQAGEGFIDFALRTADLDAEVFRLREEGVDVPDPVPGGRKRPDGEMVEWQTMRLDPERYPSLPFYCHSTNDRALRVPFGDATLHANGAIGIDTIFIGVSDLDQAAADYGLVAGIAFEEVPHTQPEANRWQSFKVGTATITLFESEDKDSDLARSITRRGEVPVEVTLNSTMSEGSAIDHNLTHGAKLAILARAATIEVPEWEQDVDA
ncbi:VOC family protein [soil metagenome]